MARPANVFGEDYRIGFKPQHVWSIPHAGEFFFLGTGGGLYLFSTWLLPILSGQLISFLLVVAGGLSLLADLGRPERLWRSLSNLRYSWISRGALAVFLFLAAAVPGAASRGLSLFPSLPTLPLLCEAVASVFALIAMLYPGFVLSSYASIPSWNSPMVPLLFFVYSWATGLAALWLMPLYFGAAEELEIALRIGLLVIPFALICLLTHIGVMARGSAAVREAFRMLTRGPLAGWFFGAVIVAGLLVPLLLIGLAIGSDDAAALVLFASLLVFGGGFSFRYCILKAGIYPPLF